MSQLTIQEQIKEKAEKLGRALIQDNEMLSVFDQAYLMLFVTKYKELPMEDLVNFVHTAQLTGADPRKKQIYLLPVWDRRQNRNVGTPVHAYHFFLNQANLTGELQGVDATVEVETVYDPINKQETQQLVATATVWRKGRQPTTFKAIWDEFFKPKSPNWKSTPYLMLRKCAIANATRNAFPESLSNCFIDAEINEDNPDSFETTSRALDDDLNRMLEDQTPENEKEKGPDFRMQNGKFRGKQLKDVEKSDLMEYFDKLIARENLKDWEKNTINILDDYITNYETYQDILHGGDDE